MIAPASLVYFLADLTDTDPSIIRRGIVEGKASIYYFRSGSMGILDKKYFVAVTDVGARVSLDNSFVVLYDGQVYYNVR